MSKKRYLHLSILIIVLSVGLAIFDYQPWWSIINENLSWPYFFARPWHLGLDLVGGSYLVYDIDLSRVPESDQLSVVNGLRDVIERRVNLFGVSEPQVFTSKTNKDIRLVVELAGIKDIKQAIREIGVTPLLGFYEVVFDSLGPNVSGTDSGILEAVTSGTPAFIPTALTGSFVTSAQLDFDQLTNQPLVNIQFNDEGSQLFEVLTEKNVGKPIAVFLDNQLIEMPVVREKINGGRAQISGSFTVDSARLLAERLNAGALPAPIRLASQQNIGASLGEESLEKAIFAGAIGALLIILFMFVYYGTFGFFADLALLVYIILTLAVFKIIPITLTLSGIAGFILSIGMAVDANILIFERVKEELKRGLSKAAAIEEGFRRAWSSIKDSNITTILTSLILYYFTSSFVQGFALALLIGVLISMFSAISVTRTFLKAFIK